MPVKHTYIMFWNPLISNIREKDFYTDFPTMLEKEGSWEIADWKDATYGDRFYFIKCRKDKTGIFMAGTLCSTPYAAQDWRGTGRSIHYVDLEIDCCVDYKRAPIITTQELEAAMPDFQWNGGASGRQLSLECALKLESMWMDYLEKNRDIFDGKRGRIRKDFID